MTQLSEQQCLRYQQELKSYLKSQKIDVNDEKIAKLVDYLSLFIKWNRAINLSAIRDPDEMLVKHLLDSLSIAAYIEGKDFIDVGTGGGLPGIPLAICFPDRNFTLLDSAGKKTRFLTQVKQSLTLDNVTVVNERTEHYRVHSPFDGVISRAFSSLSNMCSWTEHMLKEQGKFWAMKGQMPEDELSQLQKHYKVDACYSLQVKGLEAERCLIVISK